MRVLLALLLIFLMMGSSPYAQTVEKPAVFPFGVWKYSDGGKWGFKDATGKVVIPPQFTDAGPFAEGLARVALGGEMKWVGGSYKHGNTVTCWDGQELQGGKYGFVDAKGDMAIKPAFAGAWDFSGGFAAVKSDGKWGYIDHAGKVVIKPQFEEAWGFSEGLAAVKKGDKWGFIDGNGKIIVEPQFQQARTFSEGLACVLLNDHFGYIDTSGKIVVKPRFDYASGFEEGLAAVAGDVDLTPEPRVISRKVNPDGSVESVVQEGFGYEKRYGFIDRTGKYVIQPKFEHAGSFQNGLAEVTLKDAGAGFIDHAGSFYVRVPGK